MKIISCCTPDDRPDVGLCCSDKSLTQQSASAECDINQIVKRFERTGVLSHLNDRVARYGDASGSVSYHEALNLVRAAEGMFAALSADIRDRFDNDPGRLLAFLEDPKNRSEAVSLGLVSEAKAVEFDGAGAEQPAALDSAKSPVSGASGAAAQ